MILILHNNLTSDKGYCFLTLRTRLAIASLLWAISNITVTSLGVPFASIICFWMISNRQGGLTWRDFTRRSSFNWMRERTEEIFVSRQEDIVGSLSSLMTARVICWFNWSASPFSFSFSLSLVVNSFTL